VIYGPVHQFGATIQAKHAAYLRFVVGGKWVSKKEVTIPARPFLGIEDRQVGKINQALDAWFTELVGS
jgi:phage gpG-like protein